MKHLPYSLIGGVGLLSLQSCASKQQVAEQEYPNVIYVFPDQYRNMAMGFWHENGFKEHINFATDPVHTPHIDKFAKESLVLSSAMSNCPLSSPHRGSLLTGMYPNKSGIPLNCNSTRPISSLRTDVECVSDVFSKNGYDCAYFGKLHADFPTPNDPENPGEYVETKRPVWDAYTPLTTGTLTAHSMNIRTLIIGIQTENVMTRKNGLRFTKPNKSFPTCVMTRTNVTRKNRSLSWSA